MRLFHKTLLTLSLTMVAISFTQTAMYIDGIEDLLGWKIFFLGWLGILQAKLENQWCPILIWFANPLYVIALIKILGSKTSSFIFACLSALLALAFLVIANSKNLLNRLNIDSVGPGYYWWLAGIIVLTFTSLHFKFFLRPNNNSKN